MVQYKSSLLNWKSKCSTFDYINLSSLSRGMAELVDAKVKTGIHSLWIYEVLNGQ